MADSTCVVWWPLIRQAGVGLAAQHASTTNCTMTTGSGLKTAETEETPADPPGDHHSIPTINLHSHYPPGKQPRPGDSSAVFGD